MAKKLTITLGIIFILLGFSGFMMPHFFGTHLSPAHNLIHLVSGALALYFSQKNAPSLRNFGVIFGTFYLLLGIAGFTLGKNTTFSLDNTNLNTPNQHVLKIIPGSLELGTQDHAIHVIFGSLFILTGLKAGREGKDVVHA